MTGSEEFKQLIVDEYGDLYRESKAWAPKQKRLEALRPVIQSWYPDLAADQTEIAAGIRYDVQVGQKAIEKDWASMADVCTAVGGMEVLQTVCTVTFKSVSGILGNTAAEALQTEERTGYRLLKAVARLAPVIELPKAA